MDHEQAVFVHLHGAAARATSVAALAATESMIATVSRLASRAARSRWRTLKDLAAEAVDMDLDGSPVRTG